MHDTSLLANELLCLHLKCFYGVQAWLTLSRSSNRRRDSKESRQEISPFPPGKNSYLRFPEAPVF